MEQQTIFDYIKPAYADTRDEILRYDAEAKLEDRIRLAKCCGAQPKRMFKSCHEYYIVCPTCGRITDTYKHMYEAMQAWNLGRYKEATK